MSLSSPLVRVNKIEDPTCYCSHFKEDIVDEGDGTVQYYNDVFLNLLN